MVTRRFLYVGCYTDASPAGIHVFDCAAREPVKVSELTGIQHPSFLAAHPSGSMLYAVSETANRRGDGGSVIALVVDPSDGSLTPAQTQTVGSEGDAPCHISVSASGEHLYVANYVSGSVAVFALDPQGTIERVIAAPRHQGSGPTTRQESPHAHCAVPHRYSPGFVAADLGIDRVIHYSNAGQVLDRLNLEPGCGPRHLAWHPTEPVCFVVGELNNTINLVRMNPVSGRLTRAGTWPTLPLDFEGTSLAAEVAVNPSGTSVYVSNRGHNSIAVFDYASGQLELRTHVPSGGETPRHFALAPSGESLIVANQDSNSIHRFAIDPSTGIPTPEGDPHRVSQPACVAFVETNA